MTTSFHVRHDFYPEVARDALVLLKTKTFLSDTDLLVEARARDLELGQRSSPTKILSSLRDLGLLQRGHPLELSPLGREVANIAIRNRLLFTELIHLRYWSLWNSIAQRGAMFAWAYQMVVGSLWDEGMGKIDSNHLVGMVIASAEETFQRRDISFSNSSVLGILHWLRALSPPCCESTSFRRRAACSPEALVLGLRRVLYEQDRGSDAPLRLDTAIRDRVCRSLLLDVEVFDDMLEQAEDSRYLQRHQGSVGDMILIHTSLLEDLVRLEPRYP